MDPDELSADDAAFPATGLWVDLDDEDRASLLGHPEHHRMAATMADLKAAAQLDETIVHWRTHGPVKVALSYEFHDQVGVFEQMTLPYRWHLSVSEAINGHRGAPSPAELLAWAIAGFPNLAGCGIFRLATTWSAHAEIPAAPLLHSHQHPSVTVAGRSPMSSTPES